MNPLKFLTALLLIMSLSTLVVGQEIVINNRGDSILLNNNGTWEYYDNYVASTTDNQSIRINTNPYLKPKNSRNKINGKNDKYVIWFDAKKWKRIPVTEINADADVALQLIDGDAYAMVIYEEIEIQIENLSNIAIENAKTVAPDIRLIDREFRSVNGNKLIWMRMDGTTQGIKITYYSYYISNENGSIQFHTFTGQSLLPKYLDDIESLLNGFIANK